ncbi:MAG: OmpH family outer membrane protein [wastewater metagenome]|nr:OmpH family outer membrane protein [Candidatus Loosdrechtia aerotolerans]
MKLNIPFYKIYKKRRAKSLTFMVTTFACLYVFLFLLQTIQGKDQNAIASPSQNIKIGVIDLNAVFEKYEKRKTLDAQLKEQEKHYQKIINDKKKELVNLKEKIQLLDLGSEARIKNEEAFEKKNIELESYAKYAEKSLVKKYKDYFENLYSEVCREVENIGKRENYDLIIKKEEPELQSGGISELQFKVGIKTVLYNSEGVDITSKVVAALNKNYAEANKGK